MVALDVYKDGEVVETHQLSASKRVYKVGRQVGVADIVLGHGSISREQATITVSASGSVTVIDLGSAHGTSISGKKLQPHKPHLLPPGRSLIFGQSTRVFKLRESDGASGGFVDAGGGNNVAANALAPAMLVKQAAAGAAAIDDPRVQAVLHVLRNGAADCLVPPDGYVEVRALLASASIVRTGLGAAELVALPSRLGDGVVQIAAGDDADGGDEAALLRALDGHAASVRVDVSLRVAPMTRHGEVEALPPSLICCASFLQLNALRQHGAGAAAATSGGSGSGARPGPLRLCTRAPPKGWRAPSLGHKAPDLLVYLQTASILESPLTAMYRVVADAGKPEAEEAGLEDLICVGDGDGGCLGPWHFEKVVSARDGSEMMGADEIAGLRTERDKAREREVAQAKAMAEAKAEAELTRKRERERRLLEREREAAKRRREEAEDDAEVERSFNPYLAHRMPAAEDEEDA